VVWRKLTRFGWVRTHEAEDCLQGFCGPAGDVVEQKDSEATIRRVVRGPSPDNPAGFDRDFAKAARMLEPKVRPAALKAANRLSRALG
jgi:hypothetical protein